MLYENHATASFGQGAPSRQNSEFDAAAAVDAVDAADAVDALD